MSSNAAKLSPADARRMAAFVLGVEPDVDDDTALHAFRVGSAQYNPAAGGNPTLYGAVVAAWAIWNQTQDAVLEEEGDEPTRGVAPTDIAPSPVEVVEAASDEASPTPAAPAPDSTPVPAVPLPTPHRAYLGTAPPRTRAVAVPPATVERFA